MKKTMYLQVLAAFLMGMAATKASSYDFGVKNEDGVTIYYNYSNGSELVVTYLDKYYDVEVGDVGFYNDYFGNVVIPGEVTYDGKAYSVTSIGENAFNGCIGLTSVTIPNSVKSIGVNAFNGCIGLTSIIIPNSVTNIEYNAFDGTAWYNNQPDGLVYAGKVLYKYKGTMPDGTLIDIDEGTVSISPYAFSNCIGLTSVTIANSVTSIDKGVFYGCRGLTSVDIPNSVTSIGSDAFAGTAWYNNQPDGIVYAGKVLYKYKGTMPNDTSIDIDANTLGIAGGAFGGSSRLTSINIPNSVTSIGDYAFYSCSSLTSITIPNSVTSIDRCVFQNCRGLTSVDIPNSVTSISNSAFSSTGLTSITIPNSVTSIGDGAFSGCSGLTSVTIPNSVVTIGDRAFCGCSNLTSVTIGNSVKSIGGRAFWNDFEDSGYDVRGKLTEVLSLIENPFYISGFDDFENPDDDNIGTFDRSTFDYATLFVPAGTIDKYRTTHGWAYFNTITEITNSPSGPYQLIYLVDGATYKTCEYYEGDSITPEAEPTKEGYTFSGWSEIPEVMPAHDVTITGSLTINKYNLTYIVDGEVYRSYKIKYGSTIIPEAEPVKEGYTFSGWSEIPEEMPAYDVTVTGTFVLNIIGQCATPTISFDGEKLLFSCETPDAEYHYEIKSEDDISGVADEVELSRTYQISVYASSFAYEDSEIKTAILCWVNTESIPTSIIEDDLIVKAQAVLIQTDGSVLSLEGIPVGTPITVYNTSGQLVGSAKASKGTTNITTTLRRGEVAIVKMGERAVKVVMK